MIFRRSHGDSEIIKIKKSRVPWLSMYWRNMAYKFKKIFYSSVWSQVLSFSKWHPLTNWFVDISMRINCSTELKLSVIQSNVHQKWLHNFQCFVFYSNLHIQSLYKSSIILQNVLTPPPTRNQKQIFCTNYIHKD